MEHGKDNPALPFTGEPDEVVPTLVLWARMKYPTGTAGEGEGEGCSTAKSTLMWDDTLT